MHEFNTTSIEVAPAEDGEIERLSTAIITVALATRDRTALWIAAALKGMSFPGSCLIDVIEVIGPPEDPGIAECVAMLAQPASVPGCELENFDVRVAGRPACNSHTSPLHP